MRNGLLLFSIVIVPTFAMAQVPVPVKPPGNMGSSPASTVAEVSGETKAVTQAILEEIDKRSELMANIEYLCDMIGPRLTGSPNLTKASQWTRDKFQQYGLTNAHLESWTIEMGWSTGTPRDESLYRSSRGFCRVSRLESFYKRSPAGTGRAPEGSNRRRAEPVQREAEGSVGYLVGGVGAALTEAARAEHGWGNAPADPRLYTNAQFRPILKKFLIEEGAAGVLRDSDKEHGLINMTGTASNFTPAALPEAFLTTESYGLIWRLLKRGPVEIEVDLRNSFSPGPVEVYNTIAEIPGADKPAEAVIIGGHIDSWDLGTGATDNGTGIMAVLEAARALKAVGAKPRRTIRFVLFRAKKKDCMVRVLT